MACACPSEDAFDCARVRDHEIDLAHEVEPCECVCHEPMPMGDEIEEEC